MLRRKYPNDFWQSVAGSLEWDETPLDAAIRELQEETGLIKQELHDCQYSRVFEIYSIWRERYAPGVTENLEHVYTVELPEKVGIVLDPGEHEQHQWLPRKQAMELAFSPANQEAIQRWVPEV